jgi:hypothetical protein
MKPLAHILPPYRRGDDVPVGVDLPAAGAASAMLIDEGALNRFSKILDPLHWTDDDESHPPTEAALKAIATVLRAPAKNDMGASPVHAILHVETLDLLRQHVTAAQVLRKYLPKSTPISIGVFPGIYTPADEAWADAEKIVDAVCYFLYPSNDVIRGGVVAWRAMVDRAAAQLKAWFPKRRKWIGFICPFKQCWWKAAPENADIAAQDWEAVPIDWWEDVNEYVKRDSRWQLLLWGACPPGDMASAVEHLAVFRRVWGLTREAMVRPV